MGVPTTLSGRSLRLIEPALNTRIQAMSNSQIIEAALSWRVIALDSAILLNFFSRRNVENK